MADSSSKNVLMLAYNYPPENIAGAVRPSRFAKYLPEFGYSAHVITASAQDGMPGPDGVSFVPDRTGIVLRNLRRFLPEEGLGWIGPAAAAAAELASRTRFAAVFSTSPPATAHAVALVLKRRTGLPWIADFRDPLCGNPARRRWAYRSIDPYLERLIFRHADAVIANTDAVGDVWRRRYPFWSGKVFVIWNGFDPEDDLRPAPIPTRRFRALMHAGVLYRNRHAGALLESVERLIRRGSIGAERLRIRLVGASEGPMSDAAVTEALTARGVLEILPRVPREEAAREIATADYLLLLDMTFGPRALQVPSKLYDYIRTGRPVLALTARNSPVERILSQSGVRYACLYADDPAEEIDRKVLAFLALPSEPVTPSAWFRETFNAVAHTRMLASILDSVCGRADRRPAEPASSSRVSPGQ